MRGTARRKLHEQNKEGRKLEGRGRREERTWDSSFVYRPSFWGLPPLREDSFAFDSRPWGETLIFLCVQRRVLTYSTEDSTTFAPAGRNVSAQHTVGTVTRKVSLERVGGRGGYAPT
eukprot:2498245-Amphidinium_carterae.1